MTASKVAPHDPFALYLAQVNKQLNGSADHQHAFDSGQVGASLTFSGSCFVSERSF